MELLNKLFIAHGAVQAVIVLALTIFFGILLGRIKIAGISFGIGGILFSGIILGHFGLSLNQQVLVFAREFGLVLFVYAIGMAVGPTFLESLRDQGLKLNLAALFIVLCGAGLAVGCYYAFDLTIPQMVGMYSGAVTNTPGLGSANEAWTLTAGSQEAVSNGLQVIGMAYAVAYPFGIFGIILTMMLLKALFHINVDQELTEIAAKRRLIGHGANSSARELKISKIIVTNCQVIGKNLSEFGKNIEILGIGRGPDEYEYNGSWRLRLMDEVYIKSADEMAFKNLADLLGDKPGDLFHPNMISIFAGIFLGVFIGSIPVFVPGLPTGLRLGVAGGTLIVAICLSRLQKVGSFVWFMDKGSNALMRELGILLFLACVGLHAGTGFVDTVLHGPGLKWMGYGAIITFIPLVLAALFCRAVWKLNFPTICGMLAGSMTDPPALAFAMQYYGGEVPASSYSTVYPLTMILRILMGQLLVLGLMATF